eukprot:gb/GEZN01000067.1/.p1 GENE.gb/GEZN01000067.1/~~gb/GEZN01000067.1/.p1  ORF type:complete len:2504 (+),score=80.67 gb/GEZN01000067.1/:509-8020(+)
MFVAVPCSSANILATREIWSLGGMIREIILVPYPRFLNLSTLRFQTDCSMRSPTDGGMATWKFEQMDMDGSDAAHGWCPSAAHALRTNSSRRRLCVCCFVTIALIIIIIPLALLLRSRTSRVTPDPLTPTCPLQQHPNMSFLSCPAIIGPSTPQHQQHAQEFTGPVVAVGSSIVHARVDKSGAFQVTLPIQVSPGTAGVQPEISLTYKSTNNVVSSVGRGWSLQVGSKIHRCPKTIPQDEHLHPVDFSSDVGYCLDGSRLVATQGSGNELTYFTEVDSGLKVVSKGSSGNGPEMFFVYKPSGQKLSFGETESARAQNGDGTVLFWSLTREEDTSGNTIVYQYLRDNLNTVPTLFSINYTSNLKSNPPITSYASVSFTYSNMSIISQQYVDGFEMRSSFQLQNISSWFGSLLFRSYQMQYQTECNSKDAILAGFQECSELECYHPVIFEWTGSCLGGFVAMNGPATRVKSTSAQATQNDMRRILFLDLDNNGLTDMYYIQGNSSAGCVNCSTTKLITNFCSGLTSVSAASAASCEAACCQDSMCTLWQYKPNQCHHWLKAGSPSCTTSPVLFLNSGEVMLYNSSNSNARSLITCDGRQLQFAYQSDSNLVVYQAGQAKWNSRTANKPTTHLVMQTDCNLVLYNGNTSMWYSSTAGWGSGCRLFLQSDGNVVIVDTAGKAVWSTATATTVCDLTENWTGGVMTSTCKVPDTITMNVGTAKQHSLDGMITTVSSDATQMQIDLSCFIPMDYNFDGHGDIYQVVPGLIPDRIHYWDNTNKVFMSKTGPPTDVRSTASEVLFDIGRIHPGEFNGDGLVDIYWQVEGSAPDLIYINRGLDSFNAVSGPVTQLRLGTSWQNFDSEAVNLGDFNGDGLVDVYVIKSGTVADDLFLNIGAGLAPQFSRCNGPITVISLTQTSTSPTAETDLNRIHFGEFNGDGLQDVYYVNGVIGATTAVPDTIFINLGNCSWKQIQGPTTSLLRSGSNTINDLARVKILDMNGDGLSDVYKIRGGIPGENNTDTVFLTRRDVTFEVTAGATTVISSSSVEATTTSLQSIRFGEFAGVGGVDLYMIMPNDEYVQQPDIIFANTFQPFLVDSVTDSLGSQTWVEYSSQCNGSVYLSNSFEYDIPVREIVSDAKLVSALFKNTGLLGAYDVYQYTYTNLLFHANYGNLGFQCVKTFHPQTQLLEERCFSQDYGKRLQHYLLSETTRSVQSSYSTSMEYQYHVDSLQTLDGQPSGYRVGMVFSVQRKIDLDGSFHGETNTSYEYDEFSNPTKVVEIINDGLEIITRITINTYWNNSSAWIIGQKTFQSQTSYFAEADETSSLTVNSSWAYNSIGMIIEQVKFPGTEFELQEVYEVNDLGIQTMLTQRSSTVSLLPRVSSSSYDALFRFVETVTSPGGNEKKTFRDAKSGLIIRSVDMNGLEAQHEYNSFGQIEREVLPNKMERLTQRYFCGEAPSSSLYDCSIPEATFLIVEAEGQKQMVSFYDSRSKLLAVRLLRDDAIVQTETQYDVLGQAIAKSYPHFMDQEPQWIRTQYDALGRAISSTDVDGSVTRVEYSGYELRTISAMGRETIACMSAFEDLHWSRSPGGRISKFEHDSQGRRTKSVSPLGLVTESRYDLTGFRVQLIDPLMGEYVYGHNAFGELIFQRDPKKREVMMSYDSSGILTNRTVTSPGNSKLEDSWQYGSGPFSRGKLSKSASSTGYSESLAYNALSQVTAKTVVTGSHQGGNLFAMSMSYNQNGLVDETILPDCFQLRYGYNIFSGSLEKIWRVFPDGFPRAVWEVIEFDASDRPVVVRYGNGLLVHHTYNWAGKLLRVFVEQPPRAGVHSKILLDLGFSYNADMQLQLRYDDIRDSVEMFEYDLDGQLVRATTKSRVSGKVIGSLNISYDLDGNILSKSDVGRYFYDKGGNALTYVLTNSGQQLPLSYDEVGNVVAHIRGQKIEYNSQNQISRLVSKKGSEYTFAYTPSGRIYQHGDPDGSYVLPFSEYQEKQLCDGSNFIERRHFVGSIASLITRAGPAPNGVCVTASEHEEWNYFVHDHLGSIVAIFDDVGVQTDSFSFDAFGLKRDPESWGSVSANALLAQDSSNKTDRGFSDHIQLFQDAQVVHLGGRMLDPWLGRFLQPDPQVQDENSGIDLNRYVYAHNDPLNIRDENGFGFGFGFVSKIGKGVNNIVKSVGGYAKTLVTGVLKSGTDVLVAVARAAVVSISTAVCGPVGPVCGVIADAAYSGLVTKLSGGSWDDAWNSFGIGLTTGALGLSDLPTGQRVFLDGLIGGANAKSNGGLFVHGFIGGARAGLGPSQGSIFESPINFLEGAAGQAVMISAQNVEQRIVSDVARGLHMSLDEFDTILLAVSFVGGPRRDVPNDVGKTIIGGFGNHFKGEHPLLSTPFDFVDAALVAQGIPSCTGWNLIFSPNQAATYDGGHSLGALEGMLLHSYKVVKNDFTVYAYPFIGFGASPGVSVVQQSGDPITGFLPWTLAFQAPFSSSFESVNSKCLLFNCHSFVGNYEKH